ncbi:hypothetical protein BH23BAC3_BH23BAC3_21700 [soil metagenome]
MGVRIPRKQLFHNKSPEDIMKTFRAFGIAIIDYYCYFYRLVNFVKKRETCEYDQ